jgi:hypothetical protein
MCLGAILAAIGGVVLGIIGALRLRNPKGPKP